MPHSRLPMQQYANVADFVCTTEPLHTSPALLFPQMYVFICEVFELELIFDLVGRLDSQGKPSSTERKQDLIAMKLL